MAPNTPDPDQVGDDLKSYIRDVPDFPKPGILFRDISPLLASATAMGRVTDLLFERYSGLEIDYVAAVEARGFFFTVPLAMRLGKGSIAIRKPGKLPGPTVDVTYDLEYGSDRLEMHSDAVKPGDRVLIVDDVLATGGTMRAACELVIASGAEVAGCAFVVELEDLGGRLKLEPEYEVFSLMRYQG